jgi:hypothetical protein
VGVIALIERDRHERVMWILCSNADALAVNMWPGAIDTLVIEQYCRGLNKKSIVYAIFMGSLQSYE